MGSHIEIVIPRNDAHLSSVAARCKSLQDADKDVVFVTANRPFGTLTTSFKEAGVDTNAVMWLDAVSSVNGHQPADRPDNAFFLQSPTMLEMIAMRAEQLMSRVKTPHVVVDCMNALSLYNGPGPVTEFSHYLTNRLRARGVDGDLLILDNDEGASLGGAIESYVDGRVEL